MRLRLKSTWLCVAITALGTALAGGSEAWAGGIKITIGQQPGGGEPPYDYIIQVYLDPGFGVNFDNSFTVDNLIGVTPGSFTAEPVNIPDGISWSPSISETQSTFPFASDVTWYFTGSNPYSNTGSGEIYLGQFAVETTVDFSTPPYMIGAPIVYTWSIVNTSGGSSTGSGIAFLGVPEPSSALLLLGGVSILPAFALRQRVRRRSLPQQR
jgi:hypothetical protein